MRRERIAVLGATSHIAKGLIFSFSHCEQYDLHPFARSVGKAVTELKAMRCGDVTVEPLEKFASGDYDVVINCIGVGRPSELESNPSQIFSVTEKFDDCVIEYLEKHRDSLCINFSSGAVYGRGRDQPVSGVESSQIDINKIAPIDYYMIAKINSEAKHRAHASLNIVDLRIFAYFSRFIDLQARYFITELISCLNARKVFVTGPEDMVRDYIHPRDLFSLVIKAIEHRKCNDSFDAYSLAPVHKFEVLSYFTEKYGLKYEIREGSHSSSATGRKDVYYSSNRKTELLGYSPQFSSMDSIVQESTALVQLAL